MIPYEHWSIIQLFVFKSMNVPCLQYLFLLYLSSFSVLYRQHMYFRFDKKEADLLTSLGRLEIEREDETSTLFRFTPFNIINK